MVSILIPVFNTARYLRQCLNSIITQSYQDLQVVIVNDGSTDDSHAISEEYAAKYPYIEVYYQENAGVASARNKLLSYVAGDYVLFVDSDDWIESEMVEHLLATAKEFRADLVSCAMVKNDALVNKTESYRETWSQEHVVREFLKHISFNGSLWNKLIRADLLRGLLFDCRISYGEDALFVWQVLQRVQTVAVTNLELYHYRMNDTSISHQSFGDKKMTGHLVWTQITDSVTRLWPQYLDIARARWAIENMWLLYFAAVSGYKYDLNIQTFQKNIRNQFKYIRKTNLIGYDKMIFAAIISHCYTFGILLRCFRRD